ncbi:hypothetical protein [Candidatus Venteria ishoeyi]|nr:hypothetical protein [Candidatus Venteria ishoeyi]
MNHRLVYFLLGFCMMLGWSNSPAFSLYVFYPSDIRPKNLEIRLSRHCQNMQITAFSKVRDFKRSLKKKPPDSILTLPALIKQISGYSLTIQGSHKGATDEAYLLVSRPPPVDKGALPSLEVGVVDLLGRRPMQMLINRLLGVKVRIKRVTKVEDILPLLTFRYVKAVFISQKDYQFLKRRSQQPLVSIPTRVRLRLPGVALRDKKLHKEVSECFRKLDSGSNALLGVDKWLLH